MRARSTNNFGINDLQEIQKICSDNNIRAYLTLNTIIYDHDIKLMNAIADAAKNNNIDAIIASDQAVLNYCKKINLPVHISTQANITNYESVEFYSAYADTMVLSRELTLMQVNDICKQVRKNKLKGVRDQEVKIEVFAHGALCMAVSGKCYLSLHSNYASANRGACVQNCRRSYIVKDKEDGIEFEIDNEYIMSAKDLCTIDILDKLIGTGISILKIEGRGRSEEYVYIATKCYREAIDAYYNNEYSAEKAEEWKKELSTVFNRGFWEGYYLGKKMGEWTDQQGSKATQKKVYLAKGLKYYSDKKVAEFKLESGQIRKGDKVIISGPSTGIIYSTIKNIRVNNKETCMAIKGQNFTIPVEEKIRPSDKLYKIISTDDTNNTVS